MANGFHGTGIADLVAAAGVTRGALYHHFGDKEQLFEAVLREVAEGLRVGATEVALGRSDDPWEQLEAGLQAHLSLVAASREIQRVLLLDGPAVFGWERWRATQSEYTRSGLIRALDLLIAGGVTPPQPTGPLADLLLAALNDAAMAIAHAEDPTNARRETTVALMTLVSGLRA